MEQSYWLGRTRDSAAHAREAASAEARLARGAVEAHPAPGLAPGDAAYYQRLETGARWLASRTGSAAERGEHLGMANQYARRRLDAAGTGR